MAALDSLNIARTRIGERIAEIEDRMARMKPVDICARMEAIRAMAAEHGLAALEGLADYGAHHALMPGHSQGYSSLPRPYGRSARQQRWRA